MSKKRSVDTHFWNDNYVADLDPIEKILFLYFLTNPLTNMLGVYEIPLRRIAFDTGIDSDMVKKLIHRFDADEKFSYIDGFVVVHNFLDHQKLNTNMKTSAKNEFLALPDKVKKHNKLERVRKALKGLGMLPKIEVESESELEVESESESKSGKTYTPAQVPIPETVDKVIEIANMKGITPEEAKMYWELRSRDNFQRVDKNGNYLAIQNWHSDMVFLWRKGALEQRKSESKREDPF